jgi:hypothetical protein
MTTEKAKAKNEPVKLPDALPLPTPVPEPNELWIDHVRVRRDDQPQYSYRNTRVDPLPS